MITLPKECPRKRDDCTSLSQIISDCKTSFICCGHNDPESRTVSGDNFRFCFKNNVIDEISDWDERDLKDTISVMAQALSVDGNMKINEEEKDV
jgi:hypothetical protein